MKKITVLIAEDHTVVREGFCRMIQLDAGLQLVGQVADGRRAVAFARELRPDLILMDIAMPQLNGLEATRQITRALPGTRVLILSAHGDDAYIRSAEDCGAAGFLLKQTSSTDVTRSIREALTSKSFFTHPAGRRHLGNGLGMPNDRLGRPRKERPHLTSRELEVLQLIAEGKANKQTAAELRIGMKTVEKHREHLMEKLDIHDTAGLTRYAISAGIIECDVHITIL
jgi:DNA-binding NarL/FixJ family response regulator